MFDESEASVLKDMFSELRGEIREMLRLNNQELKKDVRDDMHALLLDSEQRMKREIRDEVHALMKASERRMTDNIADLLDTAILPQISELQDDMSLVKRHLKLA